MTMTMTMTINSDAVLGTGLADLCSIVPKIRGNLASAEHAILQLAGCPRARDDASQMCSNRATDMMLSREALTEGTP